MVSSFHEDIVSTSWWYLHILVQTLQLTTLRTSFLCICPLLPIHVLRGWCHSSYLCFWMVSCDYSIFFEVSFSYSWVYFVWINGGWGNAFTYNITCLTVTIKWAVALVFTVALVSGVIFSSVTFSLWVLIILDKFSVKQQLTLTIYLLNIFWSFLI